MWKLYQFMPADLRPLDHWFQDVLCFKCIKTKKQMPLLEERYEQTTDLIWLQIFKEKNLKQNLF